MLNKKRSRIYEMRYQVGQPTEKVHCRDCKDWSHWANGARRCERAMEHGIPGFAWNPNWCGCKLFVRRTDES